MIQKEDNIRNLTGKILLSTSSTIDSYLDKSMVFICGHDAKGAMGIVINKLIPDIQITELLKKMNPSQRKDIPDIEIHYGGPEEINRCFILHSDEYMLGNSQLIKDHLALTISQDVVHAAFSLSNIDQKILCMGCCLWEPDQLENEVASSEWVAIDSDEALLFGDTHSKKWNAALLKIGIKTSLFSKLYGTA